MAKEIFAPFKLQITKTWDSSDYDSIVLVTSNLSKLEKEFPTLYATVADYVKYDKAATKEPTLVVSGALKPKKIMTCRMESYLPSRSYDKVQELFNYEKYVDYFFLCGNEETVFSFVNVGASDYEDVRLFYDSTLRGILRTVKSGSSHPVLICLPEYYNHAFEVSLLAAMDAIYLPLEVREHDKTHRVQQLSVYLPDEKNIDIVRKLEALNDGKTVMKDVGGGQPELMTPPAIANYILKLFENEPLIKVTCIYDDEILEKDFPLFSAVNRGSKDVKRYRGCIVKLEYNENSSDYERHLFFVGKGITYDTGGVNLKVQGMRYMSFDKCGAACIIGFFETLRKVHPKKLKVTAYLAMARNNIGEEAYVSDEIITAASGVKICVGNTDAEGRMVMADPLFHAKTLAETSKNPCIFSIATLTGHVGIVYGSGYTAVIENSVASSKNLGSLLKNVGTSIGDPIEISFLRREDFEVIKYNGDKADVLQCNDLPSSRTPRGHNFPAAFLMRTSRLSDNGCTSQVPIPYCHLDIASGVDQSAMKLDHPRAAALSALVYTFIFDAS